MIKAKRPNRTITRDISVEEFASAMQDMLAARPGVVRAMKDLADDRSIPFDVLMHEMIAAAYHVQGKPLPPRLREYLMKHDTKMPAELRQILLKPGLQ